METLLISKALLVFMVSLVFYVAARVFYVVWWKPKRLESQLRRQGIQGSSYTFLRGDMDQIKKANKEAWSKPISLNQSAPPRVSPFFYKMVQNYGKVCLSWIETRPRLILAEPELIRMVLADKNGHFVKPPLNPLVHLLLRGLSALEAEQWAERRRLISPAFHLDKLKGMLPAFSTSCYNLVNRWKNLIGDAESCEVDVAPEFQKLASDVIARTAFGSSFEDGHRIFQLQAEQAVLVLEAYYGVYIPGLRYIPTKKNKRRYEIDNEIKSILREMINKKEQTLKPGNNTDLLGLLLQCKDQSDSILTLDDVMEECKLFYLAGKETTATLLTWTLVVLSVHQNWQQKAREEVFDICGNRTPDYESISRLKTVTMILHEVLRLYPPAAAQFRHTNRETNIGGKIIPAGVDLYLPLVLVHYDSQYWGDNVEEFNPERFANGVSNASKDGAAFYPFGWGPRICLGQSFTMIESKMTLAHILQRFWFKLSPAYTHAPYTTITVQPQHGAPILLHRI